MAQTAFNVKFGAVLDYASLTAGVTKMYSDISKMPPIKINTQIGGGVDTANAQSILTNIQSQAKMIESVTVKQSTFINKATGETKNFITSMTTVWKDSTGRMVTDIRPVENEINKLGKGFELLNKTVVKDPVGQKVREIEKYYKDQNKEMQGMIENAKSWSIRAEKMGEVEKKAIQESVAALLEKKKAYDLANASGNTEEIDKAANALREQNKVVQENIDKTKLAANAVRSWGQNIKNAIVQTISYSISLGLVRKAQQFLNESIKYAIDLNKEMTKIQVLQVEGAQSPEQINRLAESYNELAKAMGVSTLEVASGSVEWLRQGKTIAETQELLKSTLMLSKLGALESAEATNYLTAITNGFKIAAEDTITVVDKLIAIDNISATSAGEMATAMRYTSVVAQEAGVTFDQLASYVATVSSVTRQNAEMVGQAFKTMFSRMTALKAGGFDETGIGISKVETALFRVGIELRDSEQSFRGMGDVLEELSGKWATLTDMEKVEIATAIAGVRQKESFLVLMNNMSMAMNYQTAAMNAAGLSEERYAIYMESVQGKMGRLTASLQELQTQLVNSDTVKFFIDLTNSIVEATNAIGGLIPVLGIVLSILTMIKREIIAINIGKFLSSLQTGFSGGFGSWRTALSGITNLTKGVKSLETVGKATQPVLTGLEGIMGGVGATAAKTAPKIGWISKAVGSLGTALGMLGSAVFVIGIVAMIVSAVKSAIDKAITEAETTLDEFTERVASKEETTTGATELVEKIKGLSGQESITEEETEALKGYYNALHDLVPELEGWKHTREGGWILSAVPELQAVTDEINKQTEATEEEIDALKTLMYWTNSQWALQTTFNKGITQNVDRIDALNTAIDILNTKGTKGLAEKLRDIRDIPYAERTEAEKDFEAAFMRMTAKSIENMDVEELVLKLENKINRIIDRVSDSKEAIDPKLQEIARSLAVVQGTAYFDELEAQYKEKYPQFWEYLLTLIASQGDIQGIFPETKTGMGEEEAFSKQTEDLSKLEEIWNNYSDVVNNAESDITDTTQALLDLNDALYLMGIPEFGEQIKSATELLAMSDEEIKEYMLSAIQAILDNQERINAMPVELIENLERQAQAIRDSISFTVESYSIGIAGVTSLTQAQFATISNDIATVMFNAAKSVGITLTDTAGVALTTAENVEAALASELLNWASFSSQVANSLAGELTGISNYIKGLFNFAGGITPYKPVMPTFSGGGGGGGGGRAGLTPEQEAEKKAIEEKIESLEEEKEAIRDMIDSYRDYIDVQKESLRRAKEEADFQDELADKNKDLADIRTEIEMLALDDSEWARARRLELEEEAAEMEEEIAEDQADRKFDLQMDALDKLQRTFEDNMQKQIEAIEELIEAFREEASEIEAVEGGVGSVTQQTQYYQEAVEDASVITKEMADQIIKDLAIEMGLTDDQIAKLQEEADKWVNTKGNIEKATAALRRYAEILGGIGGAGTIFEQEYNMGNGLYAKHSGGLIEAHHNGEFAGNLKTNEVFAKLLKGEYVATEDQMRKFMTTTLPSMLNISPKLSSTNNAIGDTTLNMEINVAGSLDEKILPDFKKAVLGEINKALNVRGIRRTATNFSI